MWQQCAADHNKAKMRFLQNWTFSSPVGNIIMPFQYADLTHTNLVLPKASNKLL